MAKLRTALLGVLLALGAAWLANSQLGGSVSPGYSSTAVGALYLRHSLHEQNIRHDPAAGVLLDVLKRDGHRTRLLVALASAVDVLSGGRIAQLILLRSVPIDREFARLVATASPSITSPSHAPNTSQLVLLGAGFDTRAWSVNDIEVRKDDVPPPVRVFELDKRETSVKKQEVVHAGGLASDWITFVPVDFQSDDLRRKVLDAPGFDPSADTLFVMEGVIYYLTHEAAIETFKSVRDIACASVMVGIASASVDTAPDSASTSVCTAPDSASATVDTALDSASAGTSPDSASAPVGTVPDPASASAGTVRLNFEFPLKRDESSWISSCIVPLLNYVKEPPIFEPLDIGVQEWLDEEIGSNAFEVVYEEEHHSAKYNTVVLEVKKDKCATR